MDTCKYSKLYGSTYSWLDNVKADAQTVTLTTKRPYVSAPSLFAARPCAYMFSPKWLGSLTDVPQRDPKSPIYDATLAATPATGDPAKPVGSGAFVFQSYTPGNGNSFKLVRNDSYWRGPNGITGEQLPYLDSVEGVAMVDIESRSNALRGGAIDIMHTTNADATKQFEDDKSFEVTAKSRYGDAIYDLI